MAIVRFALLGGSGGMPPRKILILEIVSGAVLGQNSTQPIKLDIIGSPW